MMKTEFTKVETYDDFCQDKDRLYVLIYLPFFFLYNLSSILKSFLASFRRKENVISLEYLRNENCLFVHGWKKNLHCPGIEPGSQEWESCMIPLHQQCRCTFYFTLGDTSRVHL